MRAIKFRGICNEHGVNYFGKFIHGYLGYENRINPVETVGDEIIKDYGIYDELAFVEIIPETVGQFTGLLDKNRKEIYEGDVIRRGDGRTDNIIYKDGEFQTEYEGWSVGWLVNHRLAELDEQIEIIGNIHEQENQKGNQ